MLFFKEPMVSFKTGLKSQNAKEKGTAVFECEIDDKLNLPDLKFKWKKNGEEIDFDINKNCEYVIDGNKHKLIINNCSLSDAGEIEIFSYSPDDIDISATAKLRIGKYEKTLIILFKINSISF